MLFSGLRARTAVLCVMIGGVAVATCGCPRDGQLVPRITASRLSGIAPLPVFFDALASTLSDGDPAAAYYYWDFSDPESSHPGATGYCAGHVFEQPGTYNVVLRVADGGGYVAESVVTIDVKRFSGKTFYVSNSAGHDANSGLSKTSALKTFDTAMTKADEAVYAGDGKGVRVLFNRGDTFPTSKGKDWTRSFQANPLIFGAYGDGPRPVIQSSGDNLTFTSIRSVSGVRWVDLEFRSTYDISRDPTGYECNAKPHFRFLEGRDRCALRCKFTTAANPWLEVGTSVETRTDIFMVDCETYDCWNTTFLGGRGVAIIGNRMERTSFEHVLRVWMADKGVISENQLCDPSINSDLGRHALKLHSANLHDSIHTNHVVVSDNIFRGSVWPVTIAPTDAWKPEKISDIIFERNTIVEDSLSTRATQQALLVSARDVTVRNNLFTGATRRPYYFAVRIMDYNLPDLPAPANIRVLNNTVAHAVDTDGTAVLLYLDGAGISNVMAANNLVYAPRGDCKAGPATVMFLLDNGAKQANLVSHHNVLYAPLNDHFAVDNGAVLSLAQWQAYGQDAGSLKADPKIANLTAWNFHPAHNSPIAGKGVQTVWVKDALDGIPRPLDGACTPGALEPLQ